jgi:hypothetical protein
MLPYSYLLQQQQQQLDAGPCSLAVGGIKGCCFSTLPGFLVKMPLLPSQQQQQQLSAGPRALGEGVGKSCCFSTLPGRSEELPSLPLQQQPQQLDEAAPAAASASSKDETFKQGDLLAEGRCVIVLVTWDALSDVCSTLCYCASSHSIHYIAFLTRTRAC